MKPFAPLKGEWFPLPRYEGVYWVSPSGEVCNRKGKILKPRPSSDGVFVEVRNNGQRELIDPKKVLEETHEAENSAVISE